MLRRTAFLALLALLGGGPAAARTAGTSASQAPVPAANATYVLSGHGWGHGVGLSQYGAYGYAQHGFAYAKIVAHYFPGTTLAPAPVARVRVLLADGRKSVTISSAAPFRVTEGAGTTHDLAAGSFTLTPALKLAVDGLPAAPLTGPLLFAPAAASTAPLTLDHPYRGSIQVNVSAGKLTAIDVVPLEGYLKGVVPSEMPYTWLPEALKAQAVAARSYALAVRKTGGPFDLYPDTRSQVYRGIDAEKPSTNAAVDATAGETVTYNGKVATTYFFSTSGGRTAAIQDAWPSSAPVPYLVSVPDPYDTISPYHNWGPFPFTAATLAAKLHVPGRVVDVQTVLNSSGRTASIVAKGTLGDVTVSASTARDVLGLRSAWVTAGVLSLTPPAAPVVYGASVQLAGIARGVDRPAVEQKAGALPWQAAGPVSAAADGTFTFATRPVTTTKYRLVAGSVAGAPVTVQVAPVVRLLVAHDTTVLRGIVRPVLAGASVDVQRLTGTSTWTAVASGTVDSTGAFQALFPVSPGTYRAYVAPGRGLAAGASPVLKVVAA